MDFQIRLNNAITAVCPIWGVSFGKEDDKSTWRIDFKPEATSAQKQAAQSVLTNFNLEDAKQKYARRQKYTRLANLKTIKGEALAVGDSDVANEIQKEIDNIR